MVREIEQKTMQSKNARRGMKIALLCCGFGVYSDSVIAPVITQIYAEFNEEPIFWLNFAISGAAIVGVFTGVFAGLLAKKVNHKYILFISTLCFSLAGMLGGLSPNVEFLILMRVIDFATDGFTVVMTAALISELFRDEAERDTLLGLSWAVSALLGMVMSLLAGFVGTYSWRAVFLINAISLIAPILVLLYVPNISIRTADKEETVEKKKGRFPIMWVVLSGGAFFLMTLLGNALYFSTDAYVVQKGLGNSAVSGVMTMINTSGALVAGLLFGRVYQKTKRWFAMFLYAGCALGFSLLFLPSSFAGIILAEFLIGVCNIASTPYYESRSAEVIPTQHLALVLGIFNVAQCSGVALASYIGEISEMVFRVTDLGTMFGMISLVFVALSLCYLMIGIKRS